MSQTIPPKLHPSPDGRHLVTLLSDHEFGQVEKLRVTAEPGGPRARVIFEHVGDTPLRFLGWRGEGTAELEFPPQAAPAYRLVLTCRAEACSLERAGPGEAPR